MALVKTKKLGCAECDFWFLRAGVPQWLLNKRLLGGGGGFFLWMMPSLGRNCSVKASLARYHSGFLFPYNPPPLPDNPPCPPTQRARKMSKIGSISIRFGPILSVFREASGESWGVGCGRGGVEERGFWKGKGYHCATKGAWAMNCTSWTETLELWAEDA